MLEKAFYRSCPDVNPKLNHVVQNRKAAQHPGMMRAAKAYKTEAARTMANSQRFK
ncbi:MAG: hypothetical protein ACLR23_06140 [Clostridia bacterium]